MNINIEDIEFGKIQSIEAETQVDMEPFMREAAYGLLANDPSAMYNIRYVNFPEECTITVKYEKYDQTWSCFNVKKEDIEECVERWTSTPVNVNNEKGNIWSKTVNGYDFKITCISYLKELGEENEL